MSDARRDSWSQYWSSGALHSCVGSFTGNYDAAIGAFWTEVFAPLGADQRVLDVATGNGALPRLLLDLRADATQLPAVDAVDLAEIAPSWPSAYPQAVAARVRFHAGVAIESLPFDSASFDLAISQYGLEYTDLRRSVDEVLRVLRPGAAIALVVHHVESLPVRLGRAEMVEIEWLLQSGGLLQRARRLQPYLARLATPAGVASVQRDPDAAKARSQFNECMRELEVRAEGSAGADILRETQAAVGALMGGVTRIGMAAAQARLNEIRDGLRLAQLRQTELVAHALDARRIGELGARLAGGDPAAAHIGEVRVQGELFGWTLRV